MKKINFKPIIYGLITAGIMWAIMIIGDLIDETLKIDFFSGFILMFAPCTLAYLIITHTLNKSIGDLIRSRMNRPKKKMRNRPTKFEYLTYISTYNFVFSFIWTIISRKAIQGIYLIAQHQTSDNLNGSEYVLYGWTGIIFLDIVIIIFAIIYTLIKLIKKAIGKQKLYRELNE